MPLPKFAQAVHSAGFVLFDSDYSATRNLEGRTHYFEPDTCRFHKSRAVFSRALDDGLIFGAVESYAVDFENTRRAFRSVFFDLDGTVIYRREREDGLRTKALAITEFWRVADTLDAKQITRDMLRRMALERKYQASQYLKVARSA